MVRVFLLFIRFGFWFVYYGVVYISCGVCFLFIVKVCGIFFVNFVNKVGGIVKY